MINLEELKLYLTVTRNGLTFIDGIQFYDQFLIYMTQLNKFTFDIKTEVWNRYCSVALQLNEDIQRSFIGRRYQQVASDVNTNSRTRDSRCHIYSLPYDFEYFYELDNSFQGGMFDKVRKLTMIDANAFEHKLFKVISQDFPSLEFLHISNRHSQKDKQHSSALITFPYLTFLGIQSAHVDYGELFLLEKNMHVPRLVNLSIQYISLTRITNNFTKDVTHFNFGKLKGLDVCQPFVRPKNFHQYFPLL